MKYLLLAAIVLLVGVLERHSPSLPLEAAIRDADQRKELTPQQFAELHYWRRHERHQAECRGQTYIATCCDKGHSYEVTCLQAKDVR